MRRWANPPNRTGPCLGRDSDPKENQKKDNQYFVESRARWPWLTTTDKKQIGRTKMNSTLDDAIEISIPTFDQQDVALLTTLGLASTNLLRGKETPLGQVTLPNDEAIISIWATSWPALFFRFDFQFPDSRQFRAETGAGDFRSFWETAKLFAQGKLQGSHCTFQVTELMHDLFERCLRCDTTFRFRVTKEQAVDYLPPRDKLIQILFPEIPAAARAVLAKNHICGICLYQDDPGQQDLARAYICTDAF